MHRRPLEGLTIKAAIFLGFGLTFGLWIFAGYQFTRRMGEVERDASALNRRYMHAQELLSTVRAQVLIGSVYVRDALLDPNPASADAYRRQLQDTYHAVDQALQQYVPVLDSQAERERIGRLRCEIDNFRTTMLEVLASDSSRWPAEARLLLQRRIVPKRELVIRVSEEVQALNRETFVQQQAGIAEIYRVSQRRIWRQLGLALVPSLGIAVLASLYSARLENQLRHQRARDVQNTHDLQRLSAKLITAQEEERRNIARELHDEVGQVLTAIKVELTLAQSAIEAAGGPARVLEDARSITDGAIQTYAICRICFIRRCWTISACVPPLTGTSEASVSGMTFVWNSFMIGWTSASCRRRKPRRLGLSRRPSRTLSSMHRQLRVASIFSGSRTLC